MNKLARVIGAAFVLVTVFSAVTLASTMYMYQAVAKTRQELTAYSGNIWIKGIQIPPINGTDEVVRVTLLIEFSNPTSLDVWIYNIEFSLFMFNESTMGNIGNPQVMDQAYVWVGGFFTTDDPDYFVPSGGNATLKAFLAVTSPSRISVLNTTDASGKYHPLVIGDLRFTIVEVDMAVAVHDLYYYSVAGVDPHDG
ncbi:MAG: hypothetical protein ACE5IJ_01620 [Thermoplasmata archaeon]